MSISLKEFLSLPVHNHIDVPVGTRWLSPRQAYQQKLDLDSGKEIEFMEKISEVVTMITTTEIE